MVDAAEECMPHVFFRAGRWWWTCQHGGARRGRRHGRGFANQPDAVYASVQHWRRMARNVARSRIRWMSSGEAKVINFW